MRDKTRMERYLEKAREATRMPVSIATINFMFDENLAFLIRAAACYGVLDVYVIGAIPARTILRPKSGSTSDFINLRSFKTPGHFLEFARDSDFDLISAELSDQAVSLHDFAFDFSRQTIIILGNETSGVPTEILLNSRQVYIPMPGIGFCLNTSQCGTAFLHECSRQWLTRREHE